MYRLHRDFMSFTSSCQITDPERNERFRIEGKWLEAGVTFTDLSSGDVLHLRPLYSMTAMWEIRRKDELIATFEGSGWILPTFTLDVAGPNDYTIEQRSGLTLDAVITRPNDGEVARIHQPSWTSGDLQIDIEPGQDEVFIAACAAILAVMRNRG